MKGQISRSNRKFGKPVIISHNLFDPQISYLVPWYNSIRRIFNDPGDDDLDLLIFSKMGKILTTGHILDAISPTDSITSIVTAF